MIDAFLSNYAAIFGAVLLACLVAFLTWRNNFKVRRANACAAFRSSVLAELGTIYPTPTTWPENIDAFLKSHFTALQIAVESFRPLVPWWKMRDFNRAWLCFYCAYPDKTTEQCYHHYFDSYDPFTSSQNEATEKCKNLFHSNVQRLLSFAKEI